MTITFIGQTSLGEDTARGQRLLALARLFQAAGHQVALFTAIHNPSLGRNPFGLTLQKRFSLNPTLPGGWVYTLLCVISILRQQPHVVHVHGWRAALLVRLVQRLMPASYVWTIDALPQSSFALPLFARWLARGYDVTVASRKIQYDLLVHYGVRTRYIPDGYMPSLLDPIPPKNWGLRKNGYYLLVTDSVTTTRNIASGYRAAKLRKKLVVVGVPLESLQRLQRTYPFITPIDVRGERSFRSLATGSHSVIVAADNLLPTAVLTLMNEAKDILAVPSHTLQETLGVTASFVSLSDKKYLPTALKSFAQKGSGRGRAARIRAQRHFTWERIGLEYKALYSLTTRPVLIDSVQPIRFVPQVSPIR